MKRIKDGFDYYIDRYEDDFNDGWYEDNQFNNEFDGFNRKNRYINKPKNNRGYRTTTHSFNRPLNGTMEFTAVPGHNLDRNSRPLSDQTMMFGGTYNTNLASHNSYLTQTIAKRQIKSNNMLATKTHQLQQRVDDLGEAMSIMSSKLDDAMNVISNEVKQTNDLISKASMDSTSTLSFKNEYVDESTKEVWINDLKREIEQQIKSEFQDKLNKYDEFVKSQDKEISEEAQKNVNEEFEKKLEAIRAEYENKIQEMQSLIKNKEEKIVEEEVEQTKDEIAKSFAQKLEEEINKIKEQNEEELNKIKLESEEKIKSLENDLKTKESEIVSMSRNEEGVEKEPVLEVVNPVKIDSQYERAMSYKEEEKRRKKKKLTIIWSCIGVAALLIIGVVVLFVLNSMFILW